MISKILAISGNTFLETIRQPVYGIVLILTGLMMYMNIALAAFTLENDNLLLRDLGLSTLLISGLFLAAFCASGVLNREIENKTVLTVISKPVSRPVLIAGKFVGLISALTTAFYLSTLMFMLVVRHEVLQNTTDPWHWPVILFGGGAIVLTFVVGAFGNFFYGWQFSSAAIGLAVPLMTLGCGIASILSAEWELRPPLEMTDLQLFAAIFLVLLLVWIISAVALTTSCRFGQVPTLAVCFVVLALGLSSDYIFGQTQYDEFGLWDQPTFIAKMAWVGYRALPNLSVFWVTDAITAGKAVSIQYLFSAATYAFLFITAILVLGLATFQKRELG
jgi:hypothetical protein